MSEEIEIWSEKASMLDFIVNPMQWIFTICTLGIYFLIVYLSRLNTRYTLTDERLKITSGLLTKKVDEIELFRIKDTKVTQTFLNRLVGIGTISVISSDETENVIISYLPNSINRREEIRDYSNKSREKKGVRTIVD
jgi:uncharacterized membrane protein YdbT with pleckstrin-like domain